MCHHTGLLVCFACLFLSTSSLSTSDKNINSDFSCNTAKLYEKYSKNGSLSLEGLDQILTSFRSVCLSHMRVTVIDSHQSPDSVNPNHTTEATAEETSGNANGTFTILMPICLILYETCFYSLVLCWSLCPLHISVWLSCSRYNKNPPCMAFPANYSVSSRPGCWNLNW